MGKAVLSFELLEGLLELLEGERFKLGVQTHGLLQERLQKLDFPDPQPFLAAFLTAFLAAFFEAFIVQLLSDGHGFLREISILTDGITNVVEVNGLVNVEAVDEAVVKEAIFHQEGGFVCEPSVKVEQPVFEPSQLHEVEDDAQLGLVFLGGIDLGEVDQQMLELRDERAEGFGERIWNVVEIAELGGGMPWLGTLMDDEAENRVKGETLCGDLPLEVF